MILGKTNTIYCAFYGSCFYLTTALPHLPKIPHENVVEPKSKIRLNLGSWPCAGSLFFCQRKIKGYRNPIRRSVPYFFLVLSPRIAQERRLGFGSVVSPVKRLNALRAVYGLLLRLVKSGAFAVSVWIAVSQPIATDFHCTTTVLAETFPSGFIAGDPFILHWLDYFEIAKCLPCKVVLELELGAAAGFGFTFSETV